MAKVQKHIPAHIICYNLMFQKERKNDTQYDTQYL